MSYVAFQYAEALFALSIEQNQVEEVLQSFDNFVAALDEDISRFLNHPKISKKEIKEVVSHSISNTLFNNFMNVLIDNSRIDHLEDVLEEFNKLVDNQNKVMNVVVYSSKKLKKVELENLSDSLHKKHNRIIKLENIVDNTIIGGLRIEFEGNILDETINNYLANLKNNLIK